MLKTLFDKIWDKHVVESIKDGPDVLYIDRHFIHEVTSPQAFAGLEQRGLKVLRPQNVVATPDHNVPTINQHLSIKDELSRLQVRKLTENCEKHGIQIFGLNHPYHGIVHIIGPELGITRPGMTIVCGDSHTATHGAFGTIAFGIGTSEVEMVLATQCLLQNRPKQMLINVEGELKEGVFAKDIILYIISKLTAGGATGYFVEYAGSTIAELTMEGRMTICNMSIEMGARGGLIAPDRTTYSYVIGREFAPQDKAFEEAKKVWQTLYTDDDTMFDKTYEFNVEDIEPMITYGTNPGTGIAITGHVPKMTDIPDESRISFKKSLEYMGLKEGEKLLGKPVNYVFVGSCTNGRIEDLREFTRVVKGKKKAPNIHAIIVPGSRQVEFQAINEGIREALEDAGFELRQPGCSSCLAMNDDKIPKGEYSVSTSNRNFEGRQGPGARTFLASPATAAATAIMGRVADVREVR